MCAPTPVHTRTWLYAAAGQVGRGALHGSVPAPRVDSASHLLPPLRSHCPRRSLNAQARRRVRAERPYVTPMSSRAHATQREGQHLVEMCASSAREYARALVRIHMHTQSARSQKHREEGGSLRA
eukprot:897932-Pleurochrysis_carterae.AAC.2